MVKMNVQEKLASLGLQKTIVNLRAAVASVKSVKTSVRKHQKKVYAVTSLRRSDRLKGITVVSTPNCASLRRSSRSAAASLEHLASRKGSDTCLSSFIAFLS